MQVVSCTININIVTHCKVASTYPHMHLVSKMHLHLVSKIAAAMTYKTALDLNLDQNLTSCTQNY